MYGCIVNMYNEFIAFVMVDDNGPVMHTLANGERLLLNVLPPKRRNPLTTDGLLKPIWKANMWIEGATDEELATYDAQNAIKIEESEPTELEQLRADVDYLAALGGVEL